MGGSQYRWLILLVNEEALELRLNNHALRYPLSTVVSRDRWHRMVCSVNIPAGQMVIFLDGHMLNPVKLDPAFRFNVAGAGLGDMDKQFTFTDYSGRSGAFGGWVDNLRVYSWPLSYEEVLYADQTLNFPALTNRLIMDSPVALSASATSGLPIDFFLVSGPAAIQGNLLTLTNAGLVTIRAFQPGNERYWPCSEERSFSVLMPTVQFTSTNFSVREGVSNALVVLQRSPESARLLGEVTFNMIGETATAGLDYADQSGVVRFAPGETTVTIRVPIINDSIAEDDETIRLILSNPKTGLVLGNPSTAILTIIDDEPKIHYVNQASVNPVFPYISWETAAANIQEAVDAAIPGDQIIVTNGTYASGGTIVNRVLVDKALTLRSVNGPRFTIIQGAKAAGGGNGGGATRCVYLANGSSLSGFTLANGAADEGGGLWCESTNAVVSNCVITGNSAYYNGGGVFGGTLNNCALSGNLAGYGGGGAWGSTLNNCTLVGNSASECGGGAYGGTLRNCIIFFNMAPTGFNYDDDDWNTPISLNYCCTMPLPANGIGNLSLDPQLASATHLSAGSPCRGAGSAVYTAGTDIDGEAWANPPSMGCGEYRPEALTGPLLVSIAAAFTNAVAGYPVGLTALIGGQPTLSAWDFDDGQMTSNAPYSTHAWAVAGDYAVVLRAYNESHAGGVGATATVHVVVQPVYYVAAHNPTPAPPYASWATAATNIQDAVDAADVTTLPPGSVLVLVTNGIYATGGRAVVGSMTNRVAVYKPLTLRSVNGPEVTMILGYQVPGKTNGDGAIRCVYLTNSAMLSGFTLTNGATSSEGDWLHEQCGGGLLCESASVVVSNCVLAGNAAYGNGGGACRGTLNNCALTGNSAQWDGGGAGYCTLNNCVLSGNSANYGGGALGGTLNNCTLTGNSASSGGGVYYGFLSPSILNNCIVYFNKAPEGANYPQGWGVTLNYCSTTPLPAAGVGNISLDPQLLDAAHVSPGSPCRGAGSSTYTTGADIDGETWATPPSIGCDEYHPGTPTGPLRVTLLATLTKVLPGYPVGMTALIDGHASLIVWDFGDGVALTNQPYTAHSWTTLGDYAVVLRAYNESHAGGVTATATVHVVAQPVHYVAAHNPTPMPPYTSWETAATNIQDAIDAADITTLPPGSVLVLVTNGVYATGGRTMVGSMTNRVAVYKPLTLRSVNGPEVTTIQGYQAPGKTNDDGAIRCVYLTKGAMLSGFTLTNGGTRSEGDWMHEQCGGGVLCESASVVISNCVLVGNSAYSSGGGAYGGTLNNCALTGNSAVYGGGGAYAGTLNNCTLTGNSAGRSGGGGQICTLNNCIIYYNMAPIGANYIQEQPDSGVSVNYCCITPLPTNGAGSITNAPLFVDYAGGNLRLQSNSPCINAGLNAYAASPTDMGGNPRLVSGTVDIGAYEFQEPGSMISYAWLQQYGLPTDGSADLTDPDGDGLNNWQEWRSGTDPTNALSGLRLLSATRAGTSVIVTWQSVPGSNYFLERSTDLSASPPFTLLAPNLSGQPGTTTSYTDTNAAAAPRLFYRVRVGQ